MASTIDMDSALWKLAEEAVKALEEREPLLMQLLYAMIKQNLTLAKAVDFLLVDSDVPEDLRQGVRSILEADVSVR